MHKMKKRSWRGDKRRMRRAEMISDYGINPMNHPLICNRDAVLLYRFFKESGGKRAMQALNIIDAKNGGRDA